MSLNTLPDQSVAADTMQKCPAPVTVYHRETGRRLRLPCRRRVCGYCGPKHWRPRVLAGLHSGLGREGDYLALLLTAPGAVDADEFNAQASAAWHRFTTYLRREWAVTYPTLEFWRVAELQQRGHVHFHVVVRGARFLPLTNATGTGLRDLAVKAGFGPFVGIRRPRDYPGGVRSLGFYFGKYLLKRYATGSGVTKLVTFSQGWRVTWITRPKREGQSLWVVLPRRRPWDALVLYDIRPDGGALRVVDPVPRWWRQAWQWRRARQAPTVGAGLDVGDPGRVSTFGV